MAKAKAGTGTSKAGKPTDKWMKQGKAGKTKYSVMYYKDGGKTVLKDKKGKEAAFQNYDKTGKKTGGYNTKAFASNRKSKKK
jgi:hypothetical protein